jgi:hypothetical protein
MQKPLFVTAIFAATLASAAHAAPIDDAWLAFAGCWRAEGDSSQRSLCIVPDADGVRMVTINDGKIESETRVVANGQPRTINQEGCSGTETARWSSDRQRVFLSAELNCGNNVTRKVSGMFAVLSGSQWASVQTVSTGGKTSVHKVRYVEAEPEALPSDVAQTFRDNRLARQTVRLGASSPLDLADVKEAVSSMDTATVQGWLWTVNQEFDLNARDLVELADAGVPGSVIDVMIAVSNPKYFAVREERADDRTARDRRRPGGTISCYDDYWYDPYNPFSYRGGFGYRPGYGCGPGYYPGWGWGGGYYGGGTVIVVDRNGPFREKGRVTRDGYKAPRDRDSSPSTGSVTSQPSKQPSSSGSSTSGSSGSSGSSDDSSGSRKAKPRDN